MGELTNIPTSGISRLIIYLIRHIVKGKLTKKGGGKLSNFNENLKKSAPKSTKNPTTQLWTMRTEQAQNDRQPPERNLSATTDQHRRAIRTKGTGGRKKRATIIRVHTFALKEFRKATAGVVTKKPAGVTINSHKTISPPIERRRPSPLFFK